VVVALAALLVHDPDPPDRPVDDAAETAADDEDVTSTGGAATDPEPAERHDCAVDRSAGDPGADADIDGDGCPEAVAVRDGVVEAGRERWAVGEPGDVVAVGDWDCDGTATPAVYRPSTGDVFVFDAWATRGGPLAAEPTAQVPDGTALDAQPEDDDCTTPVVVTADGRRHPVVVAR
jgi:eukaryotic-like serine/threonine-protein kinase